MKQVNAQDIIIATGGELVVGDTDVFVDQVTTDTRSVPERAVFFALKGERFDANDFLEKAVHAGATLIIAERVPKDFEAGSTTVVLVEDTLIALQRFAKWYRDQLNIPVIAITGSNGKTSTKDFARSVLSEAFSVNATKGNFNNHIGLPLSVLATEEHHTACVWEMGMNHPGEIAPLCRIAQPTVGMVTNIGTAHIEHMGSREGIAEEKGALPRSLAESASFLFPAGCDFGDYFKERTRAKCIPVGNGRGIVRAENLKMHTTSSEFDLVVQGRGRARVHLPVAGRHMINNALLAAGAGYVLGMSVEQIAKGLAKTELTSGRLRVYEVGGVTVFDDTYNANPESVAAALETLAETPVKNGHARVAVLGRMGELGAHEQAANVKLGSLAANRDLTVVTVGEGADRISNAARNAGGDAQHFEQVDEAASWLNSQASCGDIYLFKGSRAAGMERVMNMAFPE